MNRDKYLKSLTRFFAYIRVPKVLQYMSRAAKRHCQLQNAGAQYMCRRSKIFLVGRWSHFIYYSLISLIKNYQRLSAQSLLTLINFVILSKIMHEKGTFRNNDINAVPIAAIVNLKCYYTLLRTFCFLLSFTDFTEFFWLYFTEF